jgi:predicted NBD/HSP70 family sugar kinase
VLAAVQRAGVSLSASDVAVAASRGDPAAVELLDASARHVGTSLAAVVNLLNPSLIVVGGGVAGAGDRYLATIRETVYRRSLPLATRSLQIVPSKLGAMAGVVGAAAMVADEVLSRDRLTSTIARLTASRRRVAEGVS